jgi:prepilin-type N-terminal cleavage/methylation domain-containing protein
MRRRSTRCGFTLLELLAVVAVIMLLMGLLLPAIMKSKQGMKKRKAQVDAAAIATAVESYYFFYKEFPAPESDLEGGRDVTYAGGAQGGNSEVLWFLLKPPIDDNGRKAEPFIDRADLAFDMDNNAVTMWRTPYKVSLDLDYDGKVNGVLGKVKVAYDTK